MQKALLLLVSILSLQFTKAQSPTCNIGNIIQTYQTQGFQQFTVGGQPCNLYFYNANNTTWQAAENIAVGLGSHLASISSQAENDSIVAGMLAAGIPSNTVVWMGYSDAASEGNWNWLDGTSSGFTNWNAGEPNNNSGFPGVGENGGQLQLSNGRWNDLMIDNVALFPAPTGTSIVKVNLCPQISVAGGTGCANQPISLTANTAFGSLPNQTAWFLPPSTTPIATGNTFNANVPTNTVYVAGVQDLWGCSDTAQVLVSVTPCVTPAGCRISEIDSTFLANGYIKLNNINNPCSMYFINPTSQSSTASEAQAQLLGAHMVSIQTPQENAEVVAALAAAGYNFNTPKIWIGLTDVSQEGNFIWLDQNTNTFTNWYAGEPNNQTPSGLFSCCTLGSCQSSIVCTQGEDCVQLYPSGEWNDQPCDLPAISVVEVNLCPVITATPDTLICENTNITLAASTILGSNPYTYTWTPGGAGSSISITPAASTTYTVRSTDRYGCYVDEPVNVSTQVCNQPVSTCNINQILTTFTNAGYVPLNGVVGQQCSMYFINPASQNAALSEQDAQQLGAHLVVFNDAAENTAVVAALNAAGIISANSAVWVGYTDQASEGNWVTLDGTPMSYLNWNGGEPNNNGQGATCCSFPDFLGGCSGSQALQCAQGEDCMQIYSSGTWNDLPCDRQSVSVIEVNLCPEITSNNDTSICGGNPVNLSASTLLGSSPYVYNWTPGNSAANPFQVTPAATTSYVVEVTDRYNCKAYDTVNVTILGGAAQSFTIAPAQVCVDAAATITYTGGSPANATYTWGFDGGTIISGSGQGPYSVEWTTAGAKNLTLDVVDNGCTSPQITQSITVNNNPVADAGADVTVCSGGTVQIGNAAVGTYTYQWNPATDLSSSSTSNPTFSSTNTTLAPIVNQIVLGVIENGCFDFDTVEITVNTVAPTTISASGPVSFCDGGSVTLTSDSIYNNYLWSNTTTSNSITVIQSGTFFMTGSDANGCQYLSNSINVTVNPAPVLSLVSSVDETCFGDNDGSITVNASGGQAPYNFDWNTTPAQSGATASNLAAGSYDVIATDGNSCADTATYSISSPAQLILTIDNVVDASCFGTTDGSVTVSTTGGNSPFTYNWSTGSTGSILSNVGAGSYSVTVNDLNNCSETNTATVAEPQQFTLATLSFDSIPFGTELPINLNVQPAGTYTYEWSPLNYLSCDDCSSPVFSAIRNSEYTVTVTDASGCTVTATVNLNVDAQKPVFIPNVFTPNGDNANDVFTVFVNNVTYYSLMIFNRSGEKVFDSFNETTGWDGFYKGKEAPPGVYVYVLNVTFLDGENQRFKGAVTLLR